MPVHVESMTSRKSRRPVRTPSPAHRLGQGRESFGRPAGRCGGGRSSDVGGVEVGAEADVAGGVTPAGAVDGGVDNEFDDHLGVHPAVGEGLGRATAPPRPRQQRRPRMPHPILRAQHRTECGLGGRGEVGAAADHLQPAVLVGAVEDEGLGVGGWAEGAADDGFGGEPGAEFCQPRTPGR